MELFFQEYCLLHDYSLNLCAQMHVALCNSQLRCLTGAKGAGRLSRGPSRLGTEASWFHRPGQEYSPERGSAKNVETKNDPIVGLASPNHKKNSEGFVFGCMQADLLEKNFHFVIFLKM